METFQIPRNSWEDFNTDINLFFCNQITLSNKMLLLDFKKIIIVKLFFKVWKRNAK